MTLNLLLVAVLAAVFVPFALRRWRGLPAREAVALIALLMVVLLAFSKKSYAPYVSMAYFPLLLSLGQTWKAAPLAWTLAGYNVIAALEPSLWHRWTTQGDFGAALLGHGAGMPAS
jgi:hypothetical protein